MNIINKIVKSFQSDESYLNDTYIIVSNILSSPVLLVKTSKLVNDVYEATTDWDNAAPNGQGRIYSFSDGMKKWATLTNDKYMNICPMAANDDEQNKLKEDADRIINYAKNLNTTDSVIDSLTDGCNGWQKPTETVVYDKKGKRVH